MATCHIREGGMPTGAIPRDSRSRDSRSRDSRSRDSRSVRGWKPRGSRTSVEVGGRSGGGGGVGFVTGQTPEKWWMGAE